MSAVSWSLSNLESPAVFTVVADHNRQLSATNDIPEEEGSYYLITERALCLLRDKCAFDCLEI